MCDYYEGPGTHVVSLSSFSTNLAIDKIYLCDSGGMANQKDPWNEADCSPSGLFQASISMAQLMSLAHGQVLRL